MTQKNNDENVGYGKPPRDTRWKHGQSGNPKGRPKGTVSLTDALKGYLTAERIGQIVNVWVDMVVKSGNMQALAEMLNRLEGKVVERHELEAKMPVTLVFQPVVKATALPEANVIDVEARELPIDNEKERKE
jgi:hypothetical protein